MCCSAICKLDCGQCPKLYEALIDNHLSCGGRVGVLYYGPPNAGKTTTVRRLCETIPLTRFLFPVHLDYFVPATRLCRLSPKPDSLALGVAMQCILRMNRVPVLEGAMEYLEARALADEFCLHVRPLTPDVSIEREMSILQSLIDIRLSLMQKTLNCQAFL